MSRRQISLIPLEGIPIIRAGDDLGGLVIAALERSHITPIDRDVLVLAQKVVSKAEGRVVRLADVVPSERAVTLAETVRKDPRLVEVILSESTEVVRHGFGVLITAHRLGFVMANAGVDQSNAGPTTGEGVAEGDSVVLLPRDPDGSAQAMKARFDRQFSIDCGVVISDSFGRPWREGAVGVALGAAGVPSLQRLAGTPDLFGRPLRVTEVATADALASAAALLMGEANEGVPAVLVRGAIDDSPATPASALVRARERDLFR